MKVEIGKREIPIHKIVCDNCGKDIGEEWNEDNLDGIKLKWFYWDYEDSYLLRLEFCSWECMKSKLEEISRSKSKKYALYKKEIVGPIYMEFPKKHLNELFGKMR